MKIHAGMSTSSFQIIKTLTLQVADEIASKAVEAAVKNQFHPIAVCVMDPFGYLIVTKRMDQCPPMAYPKISLAKANTCVSMKMSSRSYGDKYLKSKTHNSISVGPETFVRGINQVCSLDGEVALFPGGVLLRAKEGGEIIGAVGVSGAAGDEDEFCAWYGVTNCSIGEVIVCEPPQHHCKTIKSSI